MGKHKILQSRLKPTTLPDIIVIIGTDAAGKDHVANIVEQMILEEGGLVEKRKRYLTGKLTTKSSSSEKSALELFLENVFLWFFPRLGFILPPILTAILRRDIARLSPIDKKIIIVGHNCLRGLAFYWGHSDTDHTNIRPSRTLQKAFNSMNTIPGLHTLVLDVENDIRKKRIAAREKKNEADNFDRYMAANPARSEQIEDVLVWLTTTYLDGQLIINNDISETQIRHHLLNPHNP